MTRDTAHMPGDFREGLNCPLLRDLWLPELSGRHDRQVAEECEHEGVENGKSAQQPPGQVELCRSDFAAQGGSGAVDLAVKFCFGQFDIFFDQIDLGLDQIDVRLRGDATGDAGVDGQRDGFGLFLFDACIAKALYFGDRVERCFGHVGSLLVLITDIEHPRPDCQHRNRDVSAFRVTDCDHLGGVLS